MSSLIVRIADPNSVFVLKTDASKFGVGCILEQIDPVTNDRYVIEYASKRFDKAAANYPAIEQESYGLIFALKHWSHYLIGKHFKVETDSSTVQWLQNKRDCLGKLGDGLYICKILTSKLVIYLVNCMLVLTRFRDRFRFHLCLFYQKTGQRKLRTILKCCHYLMIRLKITDRSQFPIKSGNLNNTQV